MSTPFDESTIPPDELHSDLTAAASSESTSSGNSHPDPITGEPDAHPAAVGVGALSAGAAGAAVGALAGPIGVLVGAAVGALAGGLAGHNVASKADVAGPSTEYASTEIDASTEGSPGEGLGFTADLADEPAAFVAPHLGSERDDTFVDGLPTGSAYFESGADSDSEEVVRTVAYYRYQSRLTGGGMGDEVSDWFEAEQEVRQQS